MRFAIINNNVVEQVILCDDQEFVRSNFSDSQHIELLDTPEETKVSAPGWEWNPKTGEFTKPAEPLMLKQLTSSEFQDKFNREEKIAIRTAEATDIPTKIFVEDFWNPGKMVDLKSQDLIDSVDYLIEKGFVKPDRRESLLSL